MEVSEKFKSWGGDWTEEKLDTFEKYVNAYLKIVHKQKEKPNSWLKKIIYFDGFAGSGSRVIEGKEKINLGILNDIYSEGYEVYRGSPERVLSMANKFDEYYFVDIDEDAINKLKNNLKNKSLLRDNCYFINKDVNIVLKKLSMRLNKSILTLIFLDPFGMNIDWETIEHLKEKKIDLWILIPSGVIINRLLDREGKLIYIDKLKKFFGLNEKEIKEEFYKNEKIETLFGEKEEIYKIENAIDKIASIYYKQLKKVFDYVTEKPLCLKNTKNVTIYNFIFASNNKTALKIATEIIKKKNEGKENEKYKNRMD
jgi:three-Cys-motif partner protein